VERKSDEERPADRVEPDDAKPTDDGPADSEVRPEADTEHVVEKKREDASVD
jgi:hypothetical protein